MFEKRIEIRWRDLDPLGHVNNAVYLGYLEDALNAWLEPALGLEWVLVRAELDFRRELRGPGGEVAVRPRVERIGSASVTAAAAVLAPDGELAAEALLVLVPWDAGTRRSRPLTESERAALAAL